MNVHATASSVTIKIPSASIFANSPFILLILLSTVSPAISTGKVYALFFGISGLSFLMTVNGSNEVFNFIFLFSSLSFKVLASEEAYTNPSIPTVPPLPTCSIIQLVMSGVSDCPILNRSNPVPSSSSAACIKYLESVHTPALSFVTTAVPAEPEKPLIHFLDSQNFGGYSLR